jgi:dethiobiotin synthetase
VNGLFVTGTDTGCGKTAVACALARGAVARGLSVRVIKPFETGCTVEGPGDALALAEAARDESPPDLICPYALRVPAAPAVAAEMEGVDLDIDRIEKITRSAQADADLVIVEGAGGLLVPIRNDLDMAGLAARLRLPILLVARASLGTINHTQLTLEVAARRGLSLLGVIVSHTTPNLPKADRANLGLLERELGTRLLAELPYAAKELVPPVDTRALLSQAATC